MIAHLRQPSGERGESLLESVISFAILAAAVVGILGAFGSIASLSDRHRVGATADTVLYQYAEAVKAGTYAPGAVVVDTTAFTATPGYTAAVTRRQCWAGAGADTTSAADFPTCTLLNDRGLQLLTLQVTGRGAQTSTTSILKRRP